MSPEIDHKTLGSESLLTIPLISAAFHDPYFKKTPRAIDQNWKDQGILPVAVSGFNPYLSAGFFAEKSVFKKWLENSDISARSLNNSDHLIKQALFFAHDYLHSWAISTIQELVGENFSYGLESVHEKNIEDYVFCHLLTEAVATVGLDYWYLSQIHLNDICPIGSRVRCLTIGYHSDYDEEIRKFNPRFRIFHPLFFDFMANFYCDGVFPGFTIDDLERSPILLNWIDHEVMYGEKQREYARLWFSYLSKEGPCSSGSSPSRPVRIRKDWQRKLISGLGQALWDAINNGTFAVRPFDSSRLWRYADQRGPDPRFSNLLHYDLKSMMKSVSKGPASEEKLSYLVYQYVSQFDLNKCALKVQTRIAELVEKKDLKALRRLLRGKAQIRRSREEPAHLLILN
jgi:hypothetical protein